MKVLVTGATGFVGHAVALAVHRAGHSLRILVRNPGAQKVQELVAATASEIHLGDVLDTTSLEGMLIGIDAIIHLVGIISEFGRYTFENIHTEGTRNVVQGAQQYGVRRFIQMSALGTRPGAASRYHQTKWAAEEIVRESGLAFTIFRPSLIYGPQDHFVNLFARIARLSPVLPIVGS